MERHKNQKEELLGSLGYSAICGLLANAHCLRQVLTLSLGTLPPFGKRQAKTFREALI